MRRRTFLAVIVLALVAAVAVALAPNWRAAFDPLPSWNEGTAKHVILDFVKRATAEGGPDFIPPEKRIATFDNDGTLWVEQPVYTEAVFTFDRVKALAPAHPEWAETEPYKSALAGDYDAVARQGDAAFQRLAMAASTGMTNAEFEQSVVQWLETARHPRFDRPYTDLVYQPMLELLAYLRDNGFKTFIVSGGGVEFMRPWAEKAYGIPPEQVLGSAAAVSFEMRDGKPVLRRLDKAAAMDVGPVKAENIGTIIGRRPVFAAGNSDGDLEMLQWTTMAGGPRLGMLVHHTDAEREWDYDRDSAIGQLDKALDQAPERGWIVVDMKRDWRTIFPFEKN
ncbi:MAG: HAD family hydrolase [Alphaproteobacteria bacterium]